MTEFRVKNRERLDLVSLMLHTPWAKERCRARAILWLDEGEPAAKIAELLQVNHQTVYNWVDRFQHRPTSTSVLVCLGTNRAWGVLHKGRPVVPIHSVRQRTQHDHRIHFLRGLDCLFRLLGHHLLLSIAADEVSLP